MHLPIGVDGEFHRRIEQAFAARLHFHPVLQAHRFVDAPPARRVVGKRPHAPPAATPGLFHHRPPVHRPCGLHRRCRRGAKHGTGLHHTRQVVDVQPFGPSHPRLPTAHAAQRTQAFVGGKQAFGRPESAQQPHNVPVPAPRFDALHRRPVGHLHPLCSARRRQSEAHIAFGRPLQGQFGQRMGQLACRTRGTVMRRVGGERFVVRRIENVEGHER
jgi:hypothetical protein